MICKNCRQNSKIKKRKKLHKNPGCTYNKDIGIKNRKVESKSQILFIYFNVQIIALVTKRHLHAFTWHVTVCADIRKENMSIPTVRRRFAYDRLRFGQRTCPTKTFLSPTSHVPTNKVKKTTKPKAIEIQWQNGEGGKIKESFAITKNSLSDFGHRMVSQLFPKKIPIPILLCYY